MGHRRLKEVWWLLLLAVMSSAIVATDKPAQADAAPPMFRRWAILAAPEVREVGVSDLLTAKLSEREFELVERDQLEAVLKELK
ncbi:MAG: hypothetical protein IAG10_06300, partial [Planctomycetaceae bacterium]|nr:hypothetical protein [Planctomycetaceae bacterium]